MPALTIRRPAAKTKPRQPSHPKATMVTDAGDRFTFPFAPTEADHGGMADSFAELERPGRKPLVRYTAEGLRTTSFSVLIAHPDHQRPIEGYLNHLRRIAASGDRITLSNLGQLIGRVVWQLTDLNIRTTARQHGTNADTRATVTLTFTEAVDAVVNLGPLSGGKKPRKGKKRPAKGGGGKARGKNTTRRYTVRKGDTLSRIALKFYDNPNAWPRIAKASKVRDPRRLRVGQRLTIPPA